MTAQGGSPATTRRKNLRAFMEGEPGRADAKRLCEQFHHIHTRLPTVLDLGDSPRAEPRAAA